MNLRHAIATAQLTPKTRHLFDGLLDRIQELENAQQQPELSEPAHEAAGGTMLDTLDDDYQAHDRDLELQEANEGIKKLKATIASREYVITQLRESITHLRESLNRRIEELERQVEDKASEVSKTYDRWEADKRLRGEDTALLDWLQAFSRKQGQNGWVVNQYGGIHAFDYEAPFPQSIREAIREKRHQEEGGGSQKEDR